jgi:hypothetical protein
VGIRVTADNVQFFQTRKSMVIDHFGVMLIEPRDGGE